jgi:hypothetical protein
LDAAQLERKIRLLSLADLGFQNIGQDLPYAHVAAVLQVPSSEVERWVIDGSFFLPFIFTRLAVTNLLTPTMLSFDF